MASAVVRHERRRWVRTEGHAEDGVVRGVTLGAHGLELVVDGSMATSRERIHG